MPSVIGSNNENAHTMTLDGMDALVQEERLSPSIRGSLKMRMQWDRPYTDEPIKVGEGQTHIITKDGMATGEQDPTPPPSQTYGEIGLDAGLEPMQPGYEQYSIRMLPYRDTIDHRLSNSVVSNLNKITSKITQLTTKFARTLNTAYRRPIVLAANFGHAYVTTLYTGAGATTAALNNLAGFHKTWSGGVEVLVSATHKIRATIKHSTDTYLVDVTQVTPGARNDADDLTPGTITFTVINGVAGYTNGPIEDLSVGDTVTALQASVIHRPNGKSNDWQMDDDDTLKLNDIINMAASMLSNGVDANPNNGMIDAYGDFKGWSSLMKDADFRQIYRDRYATDEFMPGSTIDVIGCRLQFGHDAPNTSRSDGLKVRSLIFCGDGAGTRGVWEESDPRGAEAMGTDEYYTATNDRYNTLFDPQTQIRTVIRKPIDRENDVVSITHKAVIGTAAQPDTEANFAENPLAAYKRLGVVKFVA